MKFRDASSFCYRCGLDEDRVRFTRTPFFRVMPRVSICEWCDRDNRTTGRGFREANVTAGGCEREPVVPTNDGGQF